VACHTVNGKGGKVGPNLSDEANKGHTKAWLAEQLRNPKSHDAQSIMPSYERLSSEQIDNLVAYLMSLSTQASKAQPAAGTGQTPTTEASQAVKPEHPAVPIARNIQAGAQMWSDNCGRCHNLRAPAEFSDSHWSVVVRHMGLRAPLTGQQQKMILAFLEASN